MGGQDTEGGDTWETRGAPIEVSNRAQDIDGELVGFSNGDDLLSSRSPDGKVLMGVDCGFPQARGRTDDRGWGYIFLIWIRDKRVGFVEFDSKGCPFVIDGGIRGWWTRSGSMGGQ